MEKGTVMKTKYIDINYCIGLFRALPSDQAIQRIKSMLTGISESVIIDGNLVVTLLEEDKRFTPIPKYKGKSEKYVKKEWAEFKKFCEKNGY